ncbi:ATP-binding protein [candidate division WOR-3 bacterium]|nr:ATP-binding protein [candidate division WOR-3 bacterium]
MTEDKKPMNGDVRVADVSIAHLSRGLYRSTAAAFKELVNNAWDADAKEVHIYTNFPEFDYISCSDNGPGMPEEKFRDYFAEKGIGFGDKRIGHRNVTDEFKRPIIGRLGIGMLAIGQLCYSFGIESHYIGKDRKGHAYKADIDLIDMDVPDIDESISKEKKEQIKVGNWRIVRVPYDDKKQGFQIYTSDVRETFRREMKEKITEEDKTLMSFNITKLHEDFYSNITRSIREMGAYLETIWELCILCPIPYADDEKIPFNNKAFSSTYKDQEYKQAKRFVNKKQEQLKNYNFKVFFDGIELKRYFQLPTIKGTVPRLFFVNYNGKVANKNLSYSGYIYGQSEAIRPFELGGIQIRLRNVGIGGYDHTFLKYDKKIETIRNRWVSGEIFVEDGLEVALNIDRDSFNEHDEHYKKVQDDLHSKLDIVFREVENSAAEVRKEKREEREIEAKKETWEVLNKNTYGKIKIYEKELGENRQIIVYDKINKRLVLNTSIRPIKRKKADNLIKYITLVYYISKYLYSTQKERDENFYHLIKEIMRKLI